MESYLKEKNLGGRQIQFSCQMKENYVIHEMIQERRNWNCANKINWNES